MVLFAKLGFLARMCGQQEKRAGHLVLTRRCGAASRQKYVSDFREETCLGVKWAVQVCPEDDLVCVKEEETCVLL